MEDGSSTKKLSIITFNILGTPFLTTHKVKNFLTLSKHFLSRMRRIAALLNESGVDIIYLQEVHLAMLLRFFIKHLSNYPYVGYKKIQSRPRGGLVIFSKLPIEYTSFTDFHFRGSLRSKAAVTRILRNGMLCVKLAGTDTVLMNVYINGDHDHIWNEQSPYHKIQEAQVEQLFTLVNFLTQLGSTCIIGGDFNFGRTSPNYAHMRKLAKITDPFAASNKPTYRKEFLPDGVSSQVLDYILISSATKTVRASQRKYLFEKPVKLVKSAKGGSASGGKKSIFLSDHIGLSLTISLISKQVN